MNFLKKLFSRGGEPDPAEPEKTGTAEEIAHADESEPVKDDAPAEEAGRAEGPEQSEELDDSYDAVLARMTADDIPGGGYESKKRKKGGVISLVLYFMFIAVFCVSAFMLARNIYAKYRGAQIYDEIADIFEGGGRSMTYVAPSPTPTLSEMTEKGGGGGAASTELARVRASLSFLSQTNPDTYGWIKIEGTPVNYPVVRGTDNDYYLDHAYTGDYLPVGSIYADFRTADSFFDNLNLVIYGHNVSDGSMFGCLSDLLADKEFFDNCRITLYTQEGIFTYKPFCVHEPGESSGFNDTWFPSLADFASFINGLKADSAVDPGDVELGESSRIITLSTCTGRGHDRRYVVHAVLVSSVTD